jgi:hypothetical protein
MACMNKSNQKTMAQCIEGLDNNIMAVADDNGNDEQQEQDQHKQEEQQPSQRDNPVPESDAYDDGDENQVSLSTSSNKQQMQNITKI